MCVQSIHVSKVSVWKDFCWVLIVLICDILILLIHPLLADGATCRLYSLDKQTPWRIPSSKVWIELSLSSTLDSTWSFATITESAAAEHWGSRVDRACASNYIVIYTQNCWEFCGYNQYKIACLPCSTAAGCFIQQKDLDPLCSCCCSISSQWEMKRYVIQTHWNCSSSEEMQDSNADIELKQKCIF